MYISHVAGLIGTALAEPYADCTREIQCVGWTYMRVRCVREVSCVAPKATLFLRKGLCPGRGQLLSRSHPAVVSSSFPAFCPGRAAPAEPPRPVYDCVDYKSAQGVMGPRYPLAASGSGPAGPRSLVWIEHVTAYRRQRQMCIRDSRWTARADRACLMIPLRVRHRWAH